MLTFSYSEHISGLHFCKHSFTACVFGDLIPCWRRPLTESAGPLNRCEDSLSVCPSELPRRHRVLLNINEVRANRNLSSPRQNSCRVLKHMHAPVASLHLVYEATQGVFVWDLWHRNEMPGWRFSLISSQLSWGSACKHQPRTEESQSTLPQTFACSHSRRKGRKVFIEWALEGMNNVAPQWYIRCAIPVIGFNNLTVL